MFPPGRYGRRREPRPARRRWVTPVAITIVVVIMGLIAVRLFTQYGNDRFAPTLVGTSGITDSSITVRFRVQKPGGEAASCTVQALAYNGAQVGQAQVPVPAGDDVTVTYRLVTTGKAYAAEIPTCEQAG